MSSHRPLPKLLSIILAAAFLTGCASVPEVVVTPEMQRDVKNFVDYRISNITELERRLERTNTKEGYIAVLDFAGSSVRSVAARGKLLVARHPALRETRTENLPQPIRQEMERATRFAEEKGYVFASLRAGVSRYGSHPSVMKALQRYVLVVRSIDQ